MIADPVRVPGKGNGRPSLGVAARRALLFEQASAAVGGAARLGEALCVSRRAISCKLTAERSLTDADLERAADAVETEAARLEMLAAELRVLARG